MSLPLETTHICAESELVFHFVHVIPLIGVILSNLENSVYKS